MDPRATNGIWIHDNIIHIVPYHFIYDLTAFTGYELLCDFFSTYYTGQTIHIETWDGEELKTTGFYNFIDRDICRWFNIKPHKIIWFTTDSFMTEKYQHIPQDLTIFSLADRYSTARAIYTTKVKFIGISIGRFSPTRFRLAYSLDTEFPNDAFIIFQPSVEYIYNKYVNCTHVYENELAWVKTRKFDTDLTSTSIGGPIMWGKSYANYKNICNEYQIEVVAETNVCSNEWFTEKVGRCLHAGKPFLLLSGQEALQRLRNMGFYTYNDVIDESYDFYELPGERITAIIASLVSLYNSKNKIEKITQLYNIAQQNRQIYLEKYAHI